MSARLHPADVEAIAEATARKLAALLADEQPTAGGLIDAKAAAARLGCSRDWIYEHADELGAIRLGDGPKAALRFDPHRIAAVASARTTGDESQRAGSRSATVPAPLRRRTDPSQESGQLPVRAVTVAELPEKTGRRRGNGPPPATRKRPSPRDERNRVAAGASSADDESSPPRLDRGGSDG